MRLDYYNTPSMTYYYGRYVAALNHMRKCEHEQMFGSCKEVKPPTPDYLYEKTYIDMSSLSTHDLTATSSIELESVRKTEVPRIDKAT